MAIPASAVKRGPRFVGFLPEDNPANYRVPQRRSSLTSAQRKALSQPVPKAASPQDDLSNQSTITRVYTATQTSNSQIPQTDELDTQQPISIHQDIQSNQQLMRRTVPWQALFIGSCLTVALYTATFLILLVWINISNVFTYGPIHTSYTHTRINGQPATLITSNDHGSIYITVIQTQKDGTIQARTYTGPALNADAWGNDLDSIVGTAQVAKDQQTITITLTGSINYFRLFFVRPTITFSLVPDKQGYKVVV